MSNAAKKTIPIAVELPTPEKCVSCLYINLKGKRHFDCHHTNVDKRGKTNPACPAGRYVIVDFNVELWAGRYAKDQINGHLKNMRIIQQKLEGLDEDTVQRFWTQANFNIALLMGAVAADDGGEEPASEEAEDDAVPSQEITAAHAGQDLRLKSPTVLVDVVDGNADADEEEAPAEEADVDGRAVPEATSSDDNDDWED